MHRVGRTVNMESVAKVKLSRGKKPNPPNGFLSKTSRHVIIGVSRRRTKRSNNPTELGSLVVFAHDDDDDDGVDSGGGAEIDFSRQFFEDRVSRHRRPRPSVAAPLGRSRELFKTRSDNLSMG